MNKPEIKSALLKLPLIERQSLLSEIELKDKENLVIYSCRASRRELLNNKRGFCPHSGDNKYVKFGFESNSQRYKCHVILVYSVFRDLDGCYPL